MTNTKVTKSQDIIWYWILGLGHSGPRLAIFGVYLLQTTQQGPPYTHHLPRIWKHKASLALTNIEYPLSGPSQGCPWCHEALAVLTCLLLLIPFHTHHTLPLALATGSHWPSMSSPGPGHLWLPASILPSTTYQPPLIFVDWQLRLTPSLAGVVWNSDNN